MKETDKVSYYNKGGFECIDVMRAVYGAQAVEDFCLLNAFKYLYRAKSKHETPIGDLKKARWYLDYLIRDDATSKDDLGVDVCDHTIRFTLPDDIEEDDFIKRMKENYGITCKVDATKVTDDD